MTHIAWMALLLVVASSAVLLAWYLVCEAPAPRGTPGICRFCKATDLPWDDHGRTVCVACAVERRSVVEGWR